MNQFKSIANIVEMPYEETIRLVRLYRENSSADIANKIIDGNTKLICQIIMKYFSTYYLKEHMEELIQAGRIGMFYGLAKYNPDRSKFSTFMTSYISGEIKHYISSELNNTTSHFYNISKKIAAATEALEKRGITPTIDDINKETGIPAPTINNATEAKEFADPIHYDKCNLAAFDAKNYTDNVEAIVESNIMNEVLENAISRLPEEYRLTILYANGFINNKTYTDTAISKILVSKGFKVNPAKVKKMRSEATRAIARDPSVIKTYGKANLNRQYRSIENGLAQFSEREYLLVKQNLDEIDGFELNLEEEIISSSFFGTSVSEEENLTSVLSNGFVGNA